MKKPEDKNTEREIPSSFAVMGQIVLPTDKPKSPKKPQRKK